MGALDLLVEEVQSRFGINDTKASSLLSGLLSFNGVPNEKRHGYQLTKNAPRLPLESRDVFEQPFPSTSILAVR